MIKKNHFIIGGAVFSGILITLALFYYYANRDLVYLVNFSNTEKDAKVEIKGVVKKYELKEGEEGVVYQVEDYVMDQDEVEIKIKAPENIADFSALEIEAEFENANNPTLEVGIRKKVDVNMGEPVFDFAYNYLDNKYLNEYGKYLGKDWTRLIDNEKGVSLFQRQAQYPDIASFLQNPPPTVNKDVSEADEFGVKQITYKDVPQIATVNYTLKQKIDQKANEDTAEELKSDFSSVPYSFRGTFSAYIYFEKTAEKQLELNFLKQDLNSKTDEDVYEVKIYDYRGNLVSYMILNDDSITDASKRINAQTYQQQIDLPESGVYTVRFVNVNYDSMIRNISVNTKKIAFNDFTLIDFDGFGVSNLLTKPATIFAKKGTITIFPEHPNASQDITVNGTSFSLDHYNKIATGTFKLADAMNEIVTSKNDVRVVHNNNPVALEKSAFFDVNPNMTMELKTIMSNDVNFVIAAYLPPETQENSKRNSAHFDLQNVDVDENGNLLFKVRAKGLSGYGNEIKLKTFAVKLLR